jgi:hypothetical protein
MSKSKTPSNRDLPTVSVASIATFAFNYLQLGLIIYVIPHLQSNPEYCLIWLSFELAILFDSLVRFGRIVVWATLAFLSCILFAVSFGDHPSNSGFMISLASVFVTSLSLKKIRTATGAKGAIKKWWRAAGYLASGFFNPWFLVLLVAPILLLSFQKPIIGFWDSEVRRAVFSQRHASAYAAIFFHHLHYFSYAYLTVVVAYKQFDIPIHLLGIYFYIGWVGYYVFERFRKHPKSKVVWGHVIAAGSVLMFGFTMQEPLVFSTLWFVTGLGGGTIILMRDFFTDADPETYDAFKVWEAMGHVLGLAVATISIIYGMTQLPFIVGALAGLSCSLFAALTSTKSSKSE